GHELAAARHVQCRHERALGAQREPVGGVLDVATPDDAAVVDERRDPDRELRVRHVGVRHRRIRRIPQRLPGLGTDLAHDLMYGLPSADGARETPTRPATAQNGPTYRS